VTYSLTGVSLGAAAIALVVNFTYKSAKTTVHKYLSAVIINKS